MLPVLLVTDFSSPYAWLVEAALRGLEEEGLVAPEYHALELHPAPLPLPGPPEVEPALPLAAGLALPLRAPSRGVRTSKAHELARLGRDRGREAAVRDALYTAYFAEDRDIARIDVLVEVAAGAGLDRSEARVVLDIDTHAAAVRGESAAARAAGIEVVPVVFLGRGSARRRVEGAFAPDEWRRLVMDVIRSTPSEG